MTTENLSENQRLFIRAAKRAGLEVRDYSGRYMFGAKCPAVEVARLSDFKTRAKTTSDSMGLGVVIYAPF